MGKLLHIIATPRGDKSNTLQVSREFLKTYQAKRPDDEIDELNLFEESLPELTVKRVDGKYELMSGKGLSPESEKAWEQILLHIERFKSADRYLLSTPMWNFSIPYKLKQYIDIIVQPGYLFQYGEKGPEGLVQGRRMVILISHGGDYSQPPFDVYDLETPYLKNIFGFVGVTDLQFVHAYSMDAGGAEVHQKNISAAQKEARTIAEDF